MSISLIEGQDAGAITRMTLSVLKHVIDKAGLVGHFRYSEVQDDCSIRRRLLQSDSLATASWHSCFRSGEVVLALLHSSDKLMNLLQEQGRPLLPVQEGSDKMSWLHLRTRFIGNWNNFLHAVRYMTKRCPTLRLENLESNIGEIIVDCSHEQKSQVLTAISLLQCLALINSDKIMSGELLATQPMLLDQCPAGQICFHQQHPLAAFDANNSANDPPALPDKNPHPQPKLNRLKGARRVTCVYDTTTAEDDTIARPAAVAAAAPQGDTTDRHCSVALTLTADAMAKLLQHLDQIRTVLAAAIAPRAPAGAQTQQLEQPLQSSRLMPIALLSLLDQHRQMQQELQQHQQQQQQQPLHQRQSRRRRQASRQSMRRASTPAQPELLPVPASSTQRLMNSATSGDDSGNQSSEEEATAVSSVEKCPRDAHPDARPDRAKTSAKAKRGRPQPVTNSVAWRNTKPQAAMQQPQRVRSDESASDTRSSDQNDNDDEDCCYAAATSMQSVNRQQDLAASAAVAPPSTTQGTRRRRQQPPTSRKRQHWLASAMKQTSAAAAAAAKAATSQQPEAAGGGSQTILKSTIHDLILRLQSVLSDDI